MNDKRTKDKTNYAFTPRFISSATWMYGTRAEKYQGGYGGGDDVTNIVSV